MPKVSGPTLPMPQFSDFAAPFLLQSSLITMPDATILVA